MVKYEKNKNTNYCYDWEKLKICDYVFTDSNNSFCSGGITYEIGLLVIEITASLIITKDDSNNIEKCSVKNRTPKQPPYAYYLGAFQSNNI